MKGWKMGMMSRHVKGRDFEGRLSRLGSPLSLVALLLYFLVPLIYYVHLTNFPLPADSTALKTGPPIFESQTQDPVPFHDRNACPICRAASSFQDYESSPAFHAPDRNSLVGLLGDGYCFTGRAKADAVTAYTRAPPVAFPAQTTA